MSFVCSLSREISSIYRPCGSDVFLSSRLLTTCGNMGLGEYPPEFNPRIHGPYHPGRFYGKADIPLGQVKVGEIGSWLSRRSYTPQAMVAATMRGYWRWATKYLLAKKTTIAPLVQFSAGLAVMYYFLQYRSHTNHRHAKYH